MFHSTLSTVGISKLGQIFHLYIASLFTVLNGHYFNQQIINWPLNKFQLIKMKLCLDKVYLI